ncbi:fumarylacetoacetate hydrolase family protein [Spiribacter onubensis]|uniref:Fumarylacetoacetate hydrolase family protein n=1 Tax=Spiribacter onubensis TaxID=3122420 RepID=A0ABV3S723_9GAMM
MSTTTAFPIRQWPTLTITGESVKYAVHRIFCVGRNYAAHAAEMGAEVDREAPFYFTKSALAFAASGQTLPYPPATSNYHHEVELVVAIGAEAFRIAPAQSRGAIYGYGCGLDMTRRDLQLAAREKQRPWDTAKDVEHSAVIADITPADRFGVPASQRIRLTVNGEPRQAGRLSDLAWGVDELISDLSHYYHLAPGDLIMTGTPAGVGPVRPGDEIVGEIEGLTPVHLTVGQPE